MTRKILRSVCERWGDSARDAEREQEAAERDGWANDGAGGIRGEPAEKEASGGGLRVDEDGSVATQDALQGTGQGGMDIHLRDGSI